MGKILVIAKVQGFEKVVMLPLGYVKFKWKMWDYDLDFKATLSQGFFFLNLPFGKFSLEKKFDL
jgi:hypothetical protein